MRPQSPSHYFDFIYRQKNYQAEVAIVLQFIPPHLKTGSKTLLDVACGTGGHLRFLKDYFQTEGLDLSEDYLYQARTKCPGILFHQGNMIDFHLQREFHVLTCLFSSIGYVRTVENLNRALRCFSSHLQTGGILIVEPWFVPSEWKPDKTHATLIDEPDLKIARMNTSRVNGKISWFDFHFLIGTPEGTEHFTEHHELGLFEKDEMYQAFYQAGFEVQYDPDGITGRGLYVGRKN